MKSVAKIFPWGSILTRRQLHLGYEFTLLAKNSSDESKATKDDDKKSKSETKSDTSSNKKPRYSKRKHCNTKVSAAVRASLLSKEDTKTTVQVPEELRDPSAAMAACASGPKRSELDQRKVRRMKCATELQELISQKKASGQVTVQRLPFVRMPLGHDDDLQKSYETPEDLLAQEPDPIKLARAFISLRNELLAERLKSETITQNYLELRAEMYTRNSKRKAAERAKAAAAAAAAAKTKPKTK